MDLKKKILVVTIVIILISIVGACAAINYQNNNHQDLSDEDDGFGCCSVILQENGTDASMSFRRDSNVTADVFIEDEYWHGIPVIKQYKVEDGYFSHVIITKDGWMIGFGGIDDGDDSKKCEEIAAGMITDNFTISNESLAQIQNIKKPYGRGHFIIKAPNGNYGFACVDKIKTGHLEPGQYISLPNNYSLSRSGELSLDSDDKIGSMTELAQSDLYGFDRRDIVTYDYHSGKDSFVDVYVSNDDGSYLEYDYTTCVDNVYINHTFVNASDIPIAPSYKNIGTLDFSSGHSTPSSITVIIFALVFVFIAILTYGVYKFVRYIRFKF